MSEVRFYHLTRQPVEAALPRLLEKVVEKGHRVLVHSPSKDKLAALDEALWTYDEASFLPHGLANSPHSDKQLVLLSDGHDNKNAADVLLLLDDAESSLEAEMPLTLIMFSGADEMVLSACRERWNHFKNTGKSLTYWQQSDSGAWVKKA